MSLWTMKEVTKKIGVTESALRYYNAKGVLPPTLQESTGRRQWLYDDEAIWKLKKLTLLKYLGLATDQIGMAISSDETYRSVVMESLEELRKARDKLDHKIFIAEMLAVSMGMDLFEPDEDLDEVEASVLNKAIREVILESVEKNEAVQDEFVGLEE